MSANTHTSSYTTAIQGNKYIKINSLTDCNCNTQVPICTDNTVTQSDTVNSPTLYKIVLTKSHFGRHGLGWPLRDFWACGKSDLLYIQGGPWGPGDLGGGSRGCRGPGENGAHSKDHGSHWKPGVSGPEQDHDIFPSCCGPEISGPQHEQI